MNLLTLRINAARSVFRACKAVAQRAQQLAHLPLGQVQMAACGEVAAQGSNRPDRRDIAEDTRRLAALHPDGLARHRGVGARSSGTRQVTESGTAVTGEAAQPLPDRLRLQVQARGGLGDGDALGTPQDHPCTLCDTPDGTARQDAQGLTLRLRCNSDKDHGDDLRCKVGSFATRYHTPPGHCKSAPYFSTVT